MAVRTHRIMLSALSVSLPKSTLAAIAEMNERCGVPQITIKSAERLEDGSVLVTYDDGHDEREA